jgi:RNA polymerase sigma-70 factor (ECF subfamily)
MMDRAHVRHSVATSRGETIMAVQQDASLESRPIGGSPGPATGTASGTFARSEDAALLDALRRREEAAFVELVRRYHPALLRAARMIVTNRDVAEEVVQETWLAALERIDAFEGRSSLKTWLTRIAINRAITRAERERRAIPFSALAGAESDDSLPSVEPERFAGPLDQWPGHWRSFPEPWTEVRVLERETQRVVRESIEALPPGQRTVITLRDVEGFSGDEVCNMLAISETNQRVLLHRARSRVRREVERHLSAA